MTPLGIAVSATGNVYIAEATPGLRIQEFDSEGHFLRLFGQEVVASGPDKVAATNAVQTLTVTATGGKYKLEFQGKETGELAYNSTAAQVKSALEGLSSIGTSNVEVTAAGSVFTITFKGALEKSPQPLVTAASAPGEPLIGGTAEVVNTTTGATGYDICVAANGDVCQLGKAGASAGAIGNGQFGAVVAPAGAPNAGNLLVADAGNGRVNEYTSNGEVIRSFGWNVVKAGPDNTSGSEFETCKAASYDVCQAGAAGTGVGQFATSTPTGIAEDSAGDLYTIEPTTNFRVQKFTLPADVVTPQGTFSAANLSGTSSSGATQNNPTAVTVDPATGDVLVTKIFPAGSIASCPITEAPSVQERRVVEVSSSGALEAIHFACAGISLATGERASGLTMRTSSASGDLYLTTGTTTSGSKIWVGNVTGPPIASISAVSEIGAHEATVTGLVNPDGYEAPIGAHTTYSIEVSRNGGVTWETAFEADAGNGTTPVAIDARFKGLEADTTYLTRIVATKPYQKTATTSSVGFSTSTSPPQVEALEPSLVNSTTAELTAWVNPNGVSTTYYFEYGTTTAYGHVTPASSAGSGGTAVGVTAPISGLSPGTPYHFRIVAEGRGLARSEDRTFTSLAGDGPPAPPSGARVFEQVTPSNKNGAGWAIETGNLEGNLENGSTTFTALSSTGESVVTSTTAVLGQPDPGSQNNLSPMLIRRTASGWESTPIATARVEPAGNPLSFVGTFGQGVKSYTPDLSALAFESPSHLEARDADEESEQNGLDFYLYHPAEPELGYQLASCPSAPGGSGEPFIPGKCSAVSRVAGNGSAFSADGSTFVYDQATEEVYRDGEGSPLFPGASGPQIYADRGGQLEWVSQPLTSVPSGATQVTGTASTVETTSWPNPVSGDGSRVFFTAGNPSRLYVRVAGERTLEVSRSRGGRGAAQAIQVKGASEDGNRALFLTSQALLPYSLESGPEVDPNSVADLYLWTYEPQSDPGNEATDALIRVDGLTQVGSGPSPDGLAAENVLGQSPDLGRVYFTAGGNLYLAEIPAGDPAAGTVRYVATVGTLACLTQKSAGETCSRTSPDGRYLAFETKSSLVAGDTDTSTDVYLFDSQTDTSELASKGSTGGSGPMDATLFGDKAMSVNNGNVDDSGQVFFVTNESLVPADTNEAQDVYEFRPGASSAELISGGKGPYNNIYAGMSADGRDVFFFTTEGLVPTDTDEGVDIYDARAGGGFPEPAPECEVLSGGCAGQGTSAPAGAGPATGTFSGVGNVKPTTPTKHKKHVKKHKKHVKKHKKKSRKKKQGNASGKVR